MLEWCVMENQAEVRIVFNDFYLKCFTTVRLVDGGSYNEGRVEVYYSGEWGTVCDNEWDENKATMVCIQLGLGTTGKPHNFGPGTGSVLLDNIVCSEEDKIITSCGHYGVGITLICSHSQDVGVKCFSRASLPKIKFYVSIILLGTASTLRKTFLQTSSTSIPLLQSVTHIMYI